MKENEENLQNYGDREKFIDAVNALSIKLFELFYCVDVIRNTDEYNKLIQNFKRPEVKKSESKKENS